MELQRISGCKTENVVSKTLKHSVFYHYDAEGNLTKKRYIADDKETVYSIEHKEDGAQIYTLPNGVVSHSKTDHLGRLEFDELQLGKGFISRRFSYHDGQATHKHIANNMLKSLPTTTLVKQILLSDGSTLSYEYDAEERITSVVDKHLVNGETNETTYEYTYDALGQLLTETVNGVAVNTMTYDNYGNILTKNGKTYTYGDSKWKDLLTEYDGQTITYDDGGNPINYLGHTLTWEKGRQLKSFDDITYTYNANGIRTSKTVNGVKHEYTLDGTNIVKETWDGNTLVPLYDNTESVCGITYNGTSYYFLKNLQGDVIAITDSTGSVVARYSYDAWGVCTIESDTTDCKIAEINPYRYRGYYLDREIEMYYIQSRYYDPIAARFINGDEAIYVSVHNTILSCNLYSYCENNCVNDEDINGCFSVSKFFGAIKNVIGLLGKFLSNVIGKFLKGYTPFKIKNNHLYINTWIITNVIDGIISLISKALSAGIKGFMSIIKLIAKFSKKNIVKFFKTKIVPFFSQKIGKILNSFMWGLIKILGKFFNANWKSVVNDFVAFNVDKVLPNTGTISNYIFSSILSFGSFISFILDLFDNKLDGYYCVRIK